MSVPPPENHKNPVKPKNPPKYRSTRAKFLGLSLESTRKSYYPQLQENLDVLRENESRLRLLTDNLPARISYVDADERFVFVNREYEKAYDLKREEIIGRSIESIIGEENYGGIHSHVRKALSGTPVRFEVFFRKNGDDPRWFEINYVPELDEAGRVKGFYDLTHDLTERKRAEEALEMAHDNLEIQVRERTMELEDSLAKLRMAQDQLVRTERMAALGNLVAGVAHEISTPVGVGITESSFLKDKVLELSRKLTEGNLTRSFLKKFSEVAAQSAANILANLERAAELIQSFKQVAVDQTEERMRPFKPKAYIEAILLSLESELKNTGHRAVVDCPEDLVLNSYPGVLSQIVTNCFMNSLLHGFEGIEEGVIEFFIRRKEEEIVFHYRDNGIGMDEKTLKQVFDPFFTTKRNLGGTGLGMQIVYNRVTQNLGGRISCNSSPGKGVDFKMRLPLTPPAVEGSVEF